MIESIVIALADVANKQPVRIMHNKRPVKYLMLGHVMVDIDGLWRKHVLYGCPEGKMYTRAPDQFRNFTLVE